jgi:hypothetical protein
MRGNHDIRPMDFFRVRYIKKDGQDHYLSGVFQAITVHHTFGTTGFDTVISAQRSGARFTPATPPLSNITPATPTVGPGTATSAPQTPGQLDVQQRPVQVQQPQ